MSSKLKLGIGAAVIAAAAGLFYASSKDVKPQPAPLEQRVDVPGYDLIINTSDDPSKVNDIELTFNNAARRLFLQNVPVYYEIPGLKTPTRIEVEKGVTGITVKFPSPTVIDGKTLCVYTDYPKRNNLLEIQLKYNR